MDSEVHQGYGKIPK